MLGGGCRGVSKWAGTWVQARAERCGSAEVFGYLKCLRIGHFLCPAGSGRGQTAARQRFVSGCEVGHVFEQGFTLRITT